jgi:hypothetical protein
VPNKPRDTHKLISFLNFEKIPNKSFPAKKDNKNGIKKLTHNIVNPKKLMFKNVV